jgi:MFS family permease
VRGNGNSPFGVLRHRAFATFWFAAVVSDIGTWMQAVAVGALVAKVTGRASATGLVAIAAFLPQSVISPLAGVLADRFDRRRMMMCGLAVQTAITIVLSVILARNKLNVGLVSGLIVVQGIANASAQPAGQALMPDLVPRAELQKAVSLGTVSWNSGRILGALLATVLGVWLSPAGIVLANAVSFAVLLVAIGTLRGSYRAPEQQRTRFLKELRNGWRSMRASPGCRFGLLGSACQQLLLTPFIGLIPIVATKLLHGGRGLTSVLTIANGVGAVLSAVLSTYLLAWIGRPRSIMLYATIGCVALGVYARAPNRYVAVPTVVFLGFATLGLFVNLSGILQRDAPHETRGRVLSIGSATNGLCYSTGVVLTGALGDWIGLRNALLLDAAVAGVVLALLAALGRDVWGLAAKGDPPSRRWQRHVAAAAVR